MSKYFVAMRNMHSQPSWMTFDSEQDFNEHYISRMEDGSNMLVSEVYPTILYQGTDRNTCQQVWKKHFDAMDYDPDRLGINLNAKLDLKE